MSPVAHAGVSTLVALAAGETWGPAAAVAAFAGGTVIDVDHFLDWRWNRMGRFTVRRFVSRCMQFRLPRFYLVAHAGEWIVPFLLWAWLDATSPLVKGFAAGLLSHACMDLLGNGLRLPAYLLTYRWWHGFDSRRLVSRLPAGGVAWWGSERAWRLGRREPVRSRQAPGPVRVQA